MIADFIGWYLIVQLITLVALPLTVRVCANLPDRGYAFARTLGILLVGLTLWLGTSYGLLRNETGGTWLALVLVGGVSVILGGRTLLNLLRTRDSAGSLGHGLNLRYLVTVELLFLVAFAAWAVVRAYDPAANHTEKPMDLMFMNGIWVSATFPPQDPWLAGYAISYYYFGYWLLVTLGRLAGQPPEVAYNLGQACWYGLLLTGSFGVGYNLLAAHRHRNQTTGWTLAGGLLSAVAVGVAGNLQVILEWLYANGVNITVLANWFRVHNFPESAAVTHDWLIGKESWWWWRSSRVLQDLDLMGKHIEVIDEFPSFSYVLGDNHPHVMAMPFALLAIGLALNLLLTRRNLAIARSAQSVVGAVRAVIEMAPLRGVGFLIIVAVTGSLVFLNTWDFPPYWLLVMLCVLALTIHGQAHPSSDKPEELTSPESASISLGHGMIVAAVVGGLVLVGTIAIYLPYLLTAQSQAGGFGPNFFNPTRLPQFLLMFGGFLPGVIALILIAWRHYQPSLRMILLSAAVVYGVPLAFLALSIGLATTTQSGQEVLQRMALPDGADSYLPFIAERWIARSPTFLLIGLLLALTIALLWQYQREMTGADNASGQADSQREAVDLPLIFVLFLAAIGLALAYVPEFVYLRDNFGSRMNTVFKFYYQAWLLLGLSAAYAIVIGLQTKNGLRSAPVLLGTLSLILMMAGTLFPIAGVYSKTGGFASSTPTWDATAYVAQWNPSERAAAEWVRANTPPDALVVEGEGGAYNSVTSRISTFTGRPTLLGWRNHENQWRGKAYAEMAHMRPETLDLIYRSGSPDQIADALSQWDIDYVYVGPWERSQYGVTPGVEERFARVMDLAFENGDVRIYRRRS